MKLIEKFDDFIYSILSRTREMKQVLIPVILILIIIFCGTFGYMLIEKMIVNPPGEMKIEEGDVLVALGNNAQIDKLSEMSQKKRIMDIN